MLDIKGNIIDNRCITEEEVRERIIEMTISKLEDLAFVWSDMFGPTTTKDNMCALELDICKVFEDQMTEAKRGHQLLVYNIGDLLASNTKFSRMLGNDSQLCERPVNMPLALWQDELRESVENKENVVNNRQDEIRALFSQQEKLCYELDEEPQSLTVEPLATKTEIQNFCRHLDYLWKIYRHRMNIMNDLRLHIKRQLEMYTLLSLTKTQQTFLRHDQRLTPQSLNNMYLIERRIATQIAEIRERIDVMRGQVKQIWAISPEANETIVNKVLGAKDYSQDSYVILLGELQRYRELNLYFDEIHQRLKTYWNLTLMTEADQKQFLSMGNGLPNTERIKMFEDELHRAIKLYNDNKEIFELYEIRSELLRRMEALDMTTNESSHCNKRVGSLLAKDQECKDIAYKLPQLELQIRNLVNAYIQEEHAPFIVNGEDILKRIENDWAARRQLKGAADRDGPEGSATTISMQPEITATGLDPLTPHSSATSCPNPA